MMPILSDYGIFDVKRGFFLPKIISKKEKREPGVKKRAMGSVPD